MPRAIVYFTVKDHNLVSPHNNRMASTKPVDFKEISLLLKSKSLSSSCLCSFFTKFNVWQSVIYKVNESK